MHTQRVSLTLVLCLLGTVAVHAADQPKLTLDEFFNAVSFSSVEVSPDGRSVVIATERGDWDRSIFRKDLWLYREDARGEGRLIPLTQSGCDKAPQWSPDGQWIAFLSARKPAVAGDADPAAEDSKDDLVQVYLISPDGGEAFPVTSSVEKVHAFSWSADSQTLFFATRDPWTKAQASAYQKQWHDVKQYRGSERGDTVFSIAVAETISRQTAAGATPQDQSVKISEATPNSHRLARSPWRIQQLVASPDGRRLAFVSASVSERQEKVEEFEIYSVDLARVLPDRAPHQLTHNQAVELSAHWAKDSQHVFFQVDVGSVEGNYMDTQTRLYWADADAGEVERWAANFGGSVTGYSVAADGRVVATGRLGTEVQVYTQAKPRDVFAKLPGTGGTYQTLSSAAHSPRIAFVYSTVDRPTEVYLADSAQKLETARAITSFNQLFTKRDLPKGKAYRWNADDGTAIEGMLIYPPGKFEAKNLPLFTLIHGGPADADGNHFEADWYQWDRMAATEGWLVFEPNYRGSSGYGDKFLMGIVPEIVSRPGKDILEGIDALVKDGIADPSCLTVGGYSYGSYMTNWLITQTDRFKAAVTGAGAVEHVANWGNDDTSFDDAYFLGGLPWESPQRYHDEAAIFQINKVRTPTHIVAGEDDIRVAVGENYLLDHALHVLGVPSELLIFPGEGHELDKNPWHGKIKVRQELKWLEKYGGISLHH
jgi:dipeptidyl aminopeptidase/acylaminoacyl peptidase